MNEAQGHNPGEQGEAISYDLQKIKGNLEEYFGFKAPDIEVVIVPTRDDFDKVRDQKTESWQVGTAKDGKVYVLHPNIWKQEGFHNPEGFPTTVKHESVHLFYSKLSHGIDYPLWLNEGLAYYVCGQRNKIRNLGDETIDPSDAFRKGQKIAPKIGYAMVENLMQDFGKEKVFELIGLSTPNMTEEEFNTNFERLFGVTPGEYYKKAAERYKREE